VPLNLLAAWQCMTGAGLPDLLFAKGQI